MYMTCRHSGKLSLGASGARLPSAAAESYPERVLRKSLPSVLASPSTTSPLWYAVANCAPKETTDARQTFIVCWNGSNAIPLGNNIQVTISRQHREVDRLHPSTLRPGHFVCRLGRRFHVGDLLQFCLLSG
jgi:hypothetical protein